MVNQNKGGKIINSLYLFNSVNLYIIRKDLKIRIIRIQVSSAHSLPMWLFSHDKCTQWIIFVICHSNNWVHYQSNYTNVKHLWFRLNALSQWINFESIHTHVVIYQLLFQRYHNDFENKWASYYITCVDRYFIILWKK